MGVLRAMIVVGAVYTASVTDGVVAIIGIATAVVIMVNIYYDLIKN
jgi:hypothetical protein